MGQVFRAQAYDGRDVAIKVLFNSQPGRRFGREVKALQSLDHPGIVRYVGASAGPPPWLAMEYVEGEELTNHMRAGLTPADAARVVAEAAEAMAHAHEHGVIHRDLKPENLLVRRRDGKILVTDFGLARSIDASRLTSTGALVGTISYASPEAVGGRRVGPPSDVWALGVILYECLTRQLPFDAETVMATIAAICRQPCPALDRLDASLPADLVATCHACLAKAPEARPTARALARALRTRRGLGAARKSPWVAALAAAALVSAAISWSLSSGPPARKPDGGDVPPKEATQGAPRSGETPATIAPWPAVAPPWTKTWALGRAEEPTVPSPTLWAEPGRVAAPLEAAKGGDSAAFLGAAELGLGGRIAVRYDLERALRPAVRRPAAYFAVGGEGANRVLASSSLARVFAPNDGSPVDLSVGAARWAAPRVRLRSRLAARVDREVFHLRLGATPGGASLQISGRSKRMSVSSGGKGARTERALGDAWTELAFEPGGDPRVVINGAPEGALSAGAPARPEPGPVSLRLGEIDVEINDLTVEGQVVRPDVPALAIVPGALSSSGRVAAAFRVDGEGLGGPLVALVDPGRDLVLSLEIDAHRLVLRRRGAVVARVDVPASTREGWLCLERASDTARGVLVTSTLQVEVEATDPLPLPGPLRAAYGSTAPRITFSAVEVFAGPEDGERADLDEAFAAGGVASALGVTPRSPRAHWRHAALLLARVSVPEVGDSTLRGPSRREERRRIAAEAGRLLRQVANAESDYRGDSLARAVLARVVAGDVENVEALSWELVRTVGAEAARALFDGLELWRGEPALLARVSEGYGALTHPEPREAALRAALVLDPDSAERGRFYADLGRLTSDRARRGPPPRAAAFQAALGFLDRARKAGYTGWDLDALQGETLADLGRYDEALRAFRSALALDRNRYWVWYRTALCLNALNRRREGLEHAFAALALQPSSAVVRRSVHTFAQDLRGADGVDGLVAAVLHALARVVGAPAVAPGEADLRPTVDPRDRDLAAYVRAQLGRSDPPSGERPTAILARARSGDAAARDALSAAGEQDPLVLHLSLLDPELRKLVR
jgi:tetratricopeptide (TPR) repeat protein/predicted Ser/Thr protein kinase